MRYFRIKEDKAAGYTGDVEGLRKWSLPGIICPACKATWGDDSKSYPSVDLTSVEALGDFKEPWPKPAEEYERLCELVRPLLPPGAVLGPGVAFGPLVGRAQGRFGAFVSPVPWLLMAQRQAVEKLQAEGVRGLRGCRMELRVRQRNFPELLELEALPAGHAHPDCLAPPRQPPCTRCGRNPLTLPSLLVLKAASLPSHLDLFRLDDLSTVIVCSERFVDAYQRLGLDGIEFHPLGLR